jgi:predicted RNA binding protein YcfA (HicA-like mRNA interferase family)
MQQFTINNFHKILLNNGFSFDRQKGGHLIYIKNGIHVSVPRKLKSVIALKLIKQQNLIL